jgi:aspartate/methionine/tyrosine aminotransferase
MDVHLEQVIAVLNEIFDELEDLWSEAETYKAMLIVRGLSDQELATAAMNSRANPECRRAAQENYAERRKRFENTTKKALIAGLSENPPPSGKSN